MLVFVGKNQEDTTTGLGIKRLVIQLLRVFEEDFGHWLFQWVFENSWCVYHSVSCD